MNPWIVLLGLVIIAVVFVIGPVGATAFASWRRPVRLTCPRTGTEAQLRVRPLLAAVASLFGREAPGIDRCSLWSTVPSCREECLALPEASRRPVPPGTPPPRPGAAPGVHTILVPLDGTPGSEDVLGTAADLARAHRATIRLVRVVAPAQAIRSEDGTRVIAFTDQETARQDLETRVYLRAVAQRLPDVKVETAVRFGDAVTGIVDEAESAGADLIALASHRRHALGQLFRGSVAARLRRATTIPTLVVPYGRRPAV